MKKYFGKFASSADVQTALDSGALSKPYVAVVGDEVEYNSKEVDYSKMPLTFEILSGGTLMWEAASNAELRTIEYSKNGGAWTSITSNTGASAPTISVVAGDKVQFRGDNSAYCGYSETTDHNKFSSTDVVYNVYGNLLSMVSSTGYTGVSSIANYGLVRMFYSTNVVDAGNLVIDVASVGRYGMLMAFGDCPLLEVAPVLTAPTLSFYSYNRLFVNDAKINYIKCLATTGMGESNWNWVNNVSATGTFVKKAGVTWETGNDGIPANWTVIEE